MEDNKHLIVYILIGKKYILRNVFVKLKILFHFFVC